MLWIVDPLFFLVARRPGSKKSSGRIYPHSEDEREADTKSSSSLISPAGPSIHPKAILLLAPLFSVPKDPLCLLFLLPFPLRPSPFSFPLFSETRRKRKGRGRKINLAKTFPPLSSFPVCVAPRPLSFSKEEGVYFSLSLLAKSALSCLPSISQEFRPWRDGQIADNILFLKEG